MSNTYDKDEAQRKLAAFDHLKPPSTVLIGDLAVTIFYAAIQEDTGEAIAVFQVQSTGRFAAYSITPSTVLEQLTCPDDSRYCRVYRLVPPPGTSYRHYKGGLYRLLAYGVPRCDNGQNLVIYRSTARGTVWARTIADWNAEVDDVPRFQRIG